MTEPVQHDLNRTAVYTLLEQRFMALALQAPGVASDRGWSDGSAADAIEQFWTDDWSVARTSGGPYTTWLGQREGTAVFVQLTSDGSWDLLVADDSQVTAEALLADLTGRLPAAAAGDDGSVPVRFWALGPMGPRSYHRQVVAPVWADVEGNYPSEVRGALGELMTMGPPLAGGGRMILMHGEPGTGKTSAIRAMAQALRGWCSLDYVIDADAFFEHAAYMVDTMVMDEAYVVEPSVDGQPEAPPWRIVVLEDSGEYLRRDATDKVGLGLGRLLNLADGLVGQGLRILILMTTNEPVEELHPAVTRPGRCMANLRMGAFPPDEANAWLAARGIDAKVEGDTTLAELYALATGAASDRQQQAVTAALAKAVHVPDRSGLLRWTATPTKENI